MVIFRGVGWAGRSGPAGWNRLAGAALSLLLLGWAGAALAQAAESNEEPGKPEREGAELVACLLPAEIDRLGQQLTILGAREKIETSRANCAARGGEVIDEHDAPPQPAEPTR